MIASDGEGDEHERRVEEPLVGDVDEDAEPACAPAHSATTAPMTASVTPTRRPPKITGSAEGISSSRSAEPASAPRLRSISSRSGSVERMPTIVAMVIGKKTIRAQITTRASSPPPNQMSSSGARARIGTAWAATMYGERTRSTRTLLPSAIPARTAATRRRRSRARSRAGSRRCAPRARRCRWRWPPRSITTSGAGQDVLRIAADDGRQLPDRKEGGEAGEASADRGSCGAVLLRPGPQLGRMGRCKRTRAPRPPGERRADRRQAQPAVGEAGRRRRRAPPCPAAGS